jgi:hypothetical protein
VCTCADKQNDLKFAHQLENPFTHLVPWREWLWKVHVHLPSSPVCSGTALEKQPG